MRKPGFTIVELVIAMAVIVLTLAVSLPRYIAFNQQQDFGASAMNVVSCLRSAQSAATANTSAPDGPSIRYTSATVRTVSSGVECKVDGYGGYDEKGVALTAADLVDASKNIRPLPALGLAQSQSGANMKVATLSVNTGSSAPSSFSPTDALDGVRVYFGSTEGGAAVAACSLGGGRCLALTARSNSAGLASAIGVTSSVPSASQLSGTITITPLGLISYDAN